MRRLDVLLARPFRLAIVFALTISVAVAAGFALIYFLVHREDAERNSSILVYEAHSNADASEETLKRALVARQTANIRRVDYIALFDAQGRPTFGNLTRMPPVPLDSQAHLIEPKDIYSPAAAGEPALFVAEKRADGGVLLMGRDLTESYQLQSTLLRILGIALIPTVVATLAIGFIFAQRATLRLRSVQDAIARIIDGDLNTRLPISREGDDIDRIARAVNVMLDEIARLLNQLASVGDNIAHDLRGPLAIARAKLERALEEGESARAAPPKLVESALSQLDRASVTIEALLRIAAVEASKRQRFADVDLARVCAEIFEFYEPLATQKSIALEVEAPEPVVIRGDLDLVREALSNLVDNAIKYTPSGGEVRVSCGTHDRQPYVEVVDSGPGVPADQRDKIFLRFFRGDSADGAPGHGLGLSIARTIAEMHGFELSLGESAGGARFVMRASARAALTLARAEAP